MCSLLYQSNALFFFVSKAFKYLVCLRMFLGEYLFYFYSDGIIKAIRPRRKSWVKLENRICPCFLRFLKKYRRNDVSLMQILVSIRKNSTFVTWKIRYAPMQLFVCQYSPKMQRLKWL